MKNKLVYLLLATLFLLSSSIAQQTYLKMKADLIMIDGGQPVKCDPPITIILKPDMVSVYAVSFQEYELIVLLNETPQTTKDLSASKSYLAIDTQGIRIKMKITRQNAVSKNIYVSVEYSNHYWVYAGYIE